MGLRTRMERGERAGPDRRQRVVTTRARFNSFKLLNLFYNGCMEEDILTAPQVAKIFGVTSAAVNHWCKDRHFPNSYRVNPFLPKSPWRIPRSDVDLFKQKRREQYGFIRMPAPSSTIATSR